MGFIYKVINIVNGDFYIGQTKNSVNKRLNCHLSNAYKRNIHNNKFYNAISFYGKDNFIIEVICEIDNSLLDTEEIKHILDLKPKYNTSEGGKSTKGFRGKKLTSGHLLKLKESNYREVYQYSLNGDFIRKFSSQQEASMSFNKKKSTISNCVNGVQDTALGYIWKREYLGDKISPLNKINSRAIPILQMDMDGNVIKKWDSMCAIEKQLNISASKICLCCQGKRKTTKGYKFKYYEE